MQSKNKENRDKFIKLVTDNPYLEILPFTSSEGCSDDYNWWLGEFGNSSIENVFFPEERVCIGEDDYEEHLMEYTELTDEEILEVIEKERKQYIVLYIDAL